MTSAAAVAIIGAGAWGTALALASQRAGRNTVLWTRDPTHAAALATTRENRRFLPGIALGPALTITADTAALAGVPILVMAVPAQHLRSTATRLAAVIAADATIIISAKGIETTTRALMATVVAEALPGRKLAILSGPTFAAEVARGQPAAVTLACADPALGARLVDALASHTFRLYLSDDVVGAQIGGAVKNVLAIACGIAAGRGLGDNARAALITRGLAEMMRLATALGGRPETLMGLSGLGDLVLTCTGPQSRNLALGLRLGQGQSLADSLAASPGVAEGVATAPAVLGLAAQSAIPMPICAVVDGILHHGRGLAATIDDLLSRPLRSERD